MGLVAVVEEGAQRFVEPGGVFCQQDAYSARRRVGSFPASKGGFELLDAGDDGFPVDLQCLRRSDGGQGVVDVVKAWQGDYDFALLRGRLDGHALLIESVHSDAGGPHFGLWTRAVTIRAVVMSQVTIEAQGIDEFRAALCARARINRLVTLLCDALRRQIKGCIVYAKVDHTARVGLAKLSHSRVIGVEYQRSGFGQRADGLLPARGDAVHLSITIKLIAKKIGKD